MKTKILVLAIAAFFAVSTCEATDTEPVSIPVGHSKSMTFDFVPSGFLQHTGEGIVTVSLPQGSSTVTLTASAGMGTSQIEFPNSSGGEGLILAVEVVDDLDEVLDSLQKELDGFDDLQFVKGKSTIRVRGTISDPVKWREFKEVLGYKEFKGKVESRVQMGVSDNTLDDLRRDLEADGVPLCPKGARPAPGQVSVAEKHGQVVFSGKVWSASDLENLHRALKSQTWLQVDDGSASVDEAKVPAVVNVKVDDSLLELGVAFVVVSKRDAKSLESDYNLTLKGVWGGITDFLIGGTHGHQDGKWNDFTINAGLSSSLSMLAENKVSRERQYGTIRFHANGDPGKALHIGGTVKVMPDAMGDGAAPEAQDFEYGFKIVNRNSRRIGADMAEADVEIEIKGEPFSTSLIKGHNSTVKQETRTDSPTVRVPLGKTVAVAGYEHLVEETIPPSGIPLLRHIPILSWFTTSRKEELDDYALLFLVSVRQVDVENEAPMVENTPMKDITYDANRPNQERIDEEYEKNKKFHGCWEPLNWFTW